MMAVIGSMVLSGCGSGNIQGNAVSGNSPDKATGESPSKPVEIGFFAPQGKAPLEDNDYTK